MGTCVVLKFWLRGFFRRSIDCICNAAVPHSFASTMPAACSKEKNDMKLYKWVQIGNLPLWSKKDIWWMDAKSQSCNVMMGSLHHDGMICCVLFRALKKGLLLSYSGKHQSVWVWLEAIESLQFAFEQSQEMYWSHRFMLLEKQLMMAQSMCSANSLRECSLKPYTCMPLHHLGTWM